MLHECCDCDKEEVWKKVRGRPYEVSNKARVRNINSGKFIKPYVNDPYGRYPYLRVTLYKKGGVDRKFYYLHRLVATYHKQKECPLKTQVHHDKTDVTWCCECNVEWVTYVENMLHRNRRNGWSPEESAPF